ncbi:thiopeptide-type bacteriocin biosynthesis protein [Micromonospora sp. WMMA1923]|uniref:thiopeptide-type bacteriocin biosynthesis protein n=1 Tax=Micromonospora sp. WMMA1923 TaxID=3404125 RepID=UPI003B95A50B
MTPPPWLSLHAFHRGDHDRLLTGAVAPLVASLRATGVLDQFFFIRYWEGGPHLRLRLLPTRPDLAADVAACTRSTLEAHLARFPSPPPGPAERYAALAERYARLEGRADHDRRIRPPDVVEVQPYQPEYPIYGGRAATRAVEGHFTDSSWLALSTLARPAAADHRSRLAVLALASALAAWQPDRHRLAHLLTRSRSHWDPADGHRARWESYLRQRTALRRLVSSCWTAAQSTRPGADPDPFVAAWSASIHRLRAELTDLHRVGDFHPDLRSVPTRFTADAGPSRFTEAGPTRLADAGPTRAEQALLVVLLRCVHLLCNRLGLGVDQETQLHYLVCAACVDLGEPAREQEDFR